MPAIRVVIQGNYADADSVIPIFQEYVEDARKAPGNLQAELFRSNEFPENLLGLYLWPLLFSSPIQANHASMLCCSSSGDISFMSRPPRKM